MRHYLATLTAVLWSLHPVAWAGPEWLEDKDGGEDAGRVPNDAQVTEGDEPVLTKIEGSLDGPALAGLGDIEDMYLIRIIDPQDFSASTDKLQGGIADFDTQLWLFGPFRPCPGDTNNDGSVDVSDLVNVISDWGTDGSANGGDVTLDGTVNVGDLLEVIVHWGLCPPDLPGPDAEALGLLGNDDTPIGDHYRPVDDPVRQHDPRIGDDGFLHYPRGLLRSDMGHAASLKRATSKLWVHTASRVSASWKMPRIAAPRARASLIRSNTT